MILGSDGQHNLDFRNVTIENNSSFENLYISQSVHVKNSDDTRNDIVESKRATQ